MLQNSSEISAFECASEPSPRQMWALAYDLGVGIKTSRAGPGNFNPENFGRRTPLEDALRGSLACSVAPPQLDTCLRCPSWRAFTSRRRSSPLLCTPHLLRTPFVFCHLASLFRRQLPARSPSTRHKISSRPVETKETTGSMPCSHIPWARRKIDCDTSPLCRRRLLALWMDDQHLSMLFSRLRRLTSSSRPQPRRP